jgi:hypothetical protein
MRSDAKRNEASALYNARFEESEKWRKVVEEKNAALADKDAALADKAAVIADKDAEISRLRALLGADR